MAVSLFELEAKERNGLGDREPGLQLGEVDIGHVDNSSMYGFHMYYTAGMDPISGVMNMSKGEKPVFNARAKKGPESEYMTTIGAAWAFKEGEGYVVRLESLPVNWDGSFILVPPREGDQ